MLSKILRNLFILAILLMNIGCDQVSKSIVRQRIEDNADIKFVLNHITLTKVENAGAFLSLGASMSTPLKGVFLNGLPLLALLGGIIFLFGKTNLSKVSRIGWGCIMGGGIGNIYDRLVYGSVTDFLHIDFGLFETGVFNLADVSIMMGSCLLVMEMFLNNKPTVQKG